MANNYSKWSFEFACNSDEYAWLKKEYDKRSDEDTDEPQFSGITLEKSERPEEKKAYFYSEMDGTIDHAADLVQAMLKHFKRTDAVYAEGAFTCSSPRPGEFGGWCVEITAKGQKWANTTQIIMKWKVAREKKK